MSHAAHTAPPHAHDFGDGSGRASFSESPLHGLVAADKSGALLALEKQATAAVAALHGMPDGGALASALRANIKERVGCDLAADFVKYLQLSAGSASSSMSTPTTCLEMECAQQSHE